MTNHADILHTTCCMRSNTKITYFDCLLTFVLSTTLHLTSYNLGWDAVCISSLIGIYYSVYQLNLAMMAKETEPTDLEDEDQHEDAEHEDAEHQDAEHEDAEHEDTEHEDTEDEDEHQYDDMPPLEPLMDTGNKIKQALVDLQELIALSRHQSIHQRKKPTSNPVAAEVNDTDGAIEYYADDDAVKAD